MKTPTNEFWINIEDNGGYNHADGYGQQKKDVFLFFFV
jgi:hypothetical protein